MGRKGVGLVRLIDSDALKVKAFGDEFGEAIVYVQDIDEAPTIDAVPVDKIVLYDLSINTKTRTAKAVFMFGDKRITLCWDCGELAPVVPELHM